MSVVNGEAVHIRNECNDNYYSLPCPFLLRASQESWPVRRVPCSEPYSAPPNCYTLLFFIYFIALPHADVRGMPCAWTVHCIRRTAPTGRCRAHTHTLLQSSSSRRPGTRPYALLPGPPGRALVLLYKL